jgi:hypothetical protein
MTVLNALTRNDYIASSGQTIFPYTFETFDSGDLVVLQNGTVLSEGSGYTVSGVGVDAGGDITLLTGAATSDSIIVYLDMALSRTINYQNAGDFLSSEVNDDFDRLWLALQQGKTDVNRAIRKPYIDDGLINMELPAASDRSQKLLAFDATGAVIAQEYTDGIQVLSRDSYIGDGSTTIFQLTASVASTLAITVVVDGLVQDANSYSISNGTSLIFSEAPPESSLIEVRSFTQSEIVATDLTTIEHTGDGSTVTFALTTNGVKQNSFVYIDGIYQFKNTYSVSGSSITFSAAPPSLSEIEVVVASFTTSELLVPADDSVNTAQLVHGSVTEPKIATGAVTEDKIATGAITADKIASVPIAVGIVTEVTAVSITATVNTLVYVSAATQTITLPLLAIKGQTVGIVVGNFVDTTVARNGSKIMSLSEDFTIDTAYLSIKFLYTDTTQGWIMA